MEYDSRGEGAGGGSGRYDSCAVVVEISSLFTFTSAGVPDVETSCFGKD